MSDLRLYSVNWQDGMLISRQHLRDQEKYFEELIQWHALRAGDHFGLIRKSSTGKAALSVTMSVSGRRLRVEITRCQALTPDGSYIDIDAATTGVIRAELDITDATVPVYVGVDQSLKKEIGSPDPSEDLPRLPYLVGNYFLKLGAAPNLPAGCYFQIAKLTINGSEVGYAPDFYPPCLSLYDDEQLAAKAVELKNRLENLLLLSTRAFTAVATTGALKGESTSLQTAFKETISVLVHHLAASVDEFVVGPNAGHPIRLVITFKKLFRVFSTLVRLHPGLQDYLNERFFSTEKSGDIGTFLSAVESFLLVEYDHRDIGSQVRAIESILDSVRGVLAFLAQTKREELGEQAMATDTLTYLSRTYRHVNSGASRLEQIGELCYLLVDIPEPRPMSDSVVLMSKGLFNEAAWRNMQVRLGLNGARGLGETDPVDVDTTTFQNKVALHPRDMLTSSSVRQLTLIFRGAPDPGKFAKLGKLDMIIYAL